MKYSSTNTSNIDSNTFKEKPPGYYKNLVNNKDNKDNNKIDTSASGKLNLVKVRDLKNNSPAANAGIPLETRKNLALKNAAFNMSKNKNSEYSRADFRKDFPNSNSAKEFNKRKLPPRVTDYSSYDPYETVLGYVISEGHADTVEEAHYVMMQMDAETIQDIVEKVGIFKDPKLNKMYPNQPKMTYKGKQTLPYMDDPTIYRGNKVVYKPKNTGRRIFGDPTGELQKNSDYKDFF